MSKKDQQVENPELNATEVVEDQVEETTADTEVTAEQRIAELEKALAESEAKVVAQKDSVLRARADVDNARRRATMDVEKAHKFALEKFANELLPVVDNLERALQVSDKENELLKPIVEGVEMTLKSMVAAVEKSGMKQINPEGEAFDPALHQAMTMVESADHKPNTVMSVMQKGYELNGRLLRPAMVVVSKAPAAKVDTQA